MAGDLHLRPATADDAPRLEILIALAAQALRGDYTAAQIEAALGSAFGLDRQLVLDGTYFVAEAGAELVACGGWSRRATLFGVAAVADGPPNWLDPARDAARVRAFFVRPDWMRRGIGRALLGRCEAEARALGFRRMELMATLAGRRLYAACGYAAGESIRHILPDGTAIEFVPMQKVLDRAA